MPTDTSPFKKAESEKESMAGPETAKGPESQAKAQDPEVAVNQGDGAPKKKKTKQSNGVLQEVIPDGSKGGESSAEPSAEQKPSPTDQRDQATLDKYLQARGPPLTRESNDVGGAIAGETQVTFDPNDDTRLGAPANPQIGAQPPKAKKWEPARTASDLDGEGEKSGAEGIQRPRAYDVNRREGQTKLGDFTIQGKDARKDAELRQHDIDVRNSQRNRPAAPSKEQQGLREEDNITGLNREAAEREKERTKQRTVEWQEQARQRAAQQDTGETPPSGSTSVEGAMPDSEDKEAPKGSDKHEAGQSETYDDYKLRNQKSRLGYWMGTFGDVGVSTAGAAGRAAEGFGRGYKAMSELAGNAIANLGDGGTPMTLASDGVAALGEGIASVYDGIVGKKKMIQNPDGTYREGTELESDIRSLHTPEYYRERDNAMMAERYINGRFNKIVEEVSRGKDVTQLSDDDIRRVYFDIEDYLKPELDRIDQKEKNGMELTMADQAYRDAYKGIAEAWSDYSKGIRRYRAERRGDLDASKKLAEEQKAGYEAQLAALQSDADSGEGAGAAGGAETARRGTGGAAGANVNNNNNNINVNTGGNKQQVKQENNQNQQVNIFFNWSGGGPDDPDRSPIPVRGFKGDDGSIYVDMGHGRGTKKVIDEDGRPTVPDIVDVKSIDEEFAEEFEDEDEDEAPAQEVSEEGAKDQDNDVLPDDMSEQEEVAPGDEDKVGEEQANDEFEQLTQVDFKSPPEGFKRTKTGKLYGVDLGNGMKGFVSVPEMVNGYAEYNVYDQNGKFLGTHHMPATSMTTPDRFWQGVMKDVEKENAIHNMLEEDQNGMSVVKAPTLPGFEDGGVTGGKYPQQLYKYTGSDGRAVYITRPMAITGQGRLVANYLDEDKNIIGGWSAPMDRVLLDPSDPKSVYNSLIRHIPSADAEKPSDSAPAEQPDVTQDVFGEKDLDKGQSEIDPDYRRVVSTSKDGDGEIIARTDGKGYQFMDRRGNIIPIPAGADVEPPEGFKGKNFVYSLNGDLFGEVRHTMNTKNGASELVKINNNGLVADEDYIWNNREWAKTHPDYFDPELLAKLALTPEPPSVPPVGVPEGATVNRPDSWKHGVGNPYFKELKNKYSHTVVDENGRVMHYAVMPDGDFAAANPQGFIIDADYLDKMGEDWAWENRARATPVNGRGKQKYILSGAVDLMAAQNHFRANPKYDWTQALNEYEKVSGRPFKGVAPYRKGTRGQGQPVDAQAGGAQVPPAGAQTPPVPPEPRYWKGKQEPGVEYYELNGVKYPWKIGFEGMTGHGQLSSPPYRMYNDILSKVKSDPENKELVKKAKLMALDLGIWGASRGDSEKKIKQKEKLELFRKNLIENPELYEKIDFAALDKLKKAFEVADILTEQVKDPEQQPKEEPKKEKEPENPEKKDYHIGEFGLDKRGFKTLNDYIDAFASPGKGIFDETYKIVEGRNPEENVEDYNALQKAMNAIQKTIKNLSPQDILLDPEYEEILQNIELYEPKRRAIMRHIKENPEKYNKWKLKNDGTYVQHKGPNFKEPKKEGEDTANPPGIDLNPKGLSNPAKLLQDEVKWKAHEVTFETWLNQVAQHNRMYAMNNALARKDYELLGGKQ